MGVILYSEHSIALVKALKAAGLIGSRASTTFELLGTVVAKPDKNVVGYAFQGWLDKWMARNDIVRRSPLNGQESPDFFLGAQATETLLELKTFDSDNSANFDIANFEAYAQLIAEKPQHLDADYLIVGYRVTESDELEFTDIWLKKVWEITGPSAAFPIKVQQKKKVIYNIRPVVWTSTRSTYKPFGSRNDFLKGIYWTLNAYRGAKAAETWRLEFNSASEHELIL